MVTPDSAAGYRDQAVSQAPVAAMRAALSDLLLECYGVILRKLSVARAVHSYAPEDLIASFWPGLHKFLPPNGRLIVAQDAAGHGLGLAIAKTWIECARTSRLLVNVIDRYPDCADPIEADPYFTYLQYHPK